MLTPNDWEREKQKLLDRLKSKQPILLEKIKNIFLRVSQEKKVYINGRWLDIRSPPKQCVFELVNEINGILNKLLELISRPMVFSFRGINRVSFELGRFMSYIKSWKTQRRILKSTLFLYVPESEIDESDFDTTWSIVMSKIDRSDFIYEIDGYVFDMRDRSILLLVQTMERARYAPECPLPPDVIDLIIEHL